jgi:hypothetical protein
MVHGDYVFIQGPGEQSRTVQWRGPHYYVYDFVKRKCYKNSKVLKNLEKAGGALNYMAPPGRWKVEFPLE